VPKKKAKFEALEKIDHGAMTYEPFRRDFYQVHPEVAAMSFGEVEDLSSELELKVSGRAAPWPIPSFKHAGFEPALLSAILKEGYEAPTPIQSAALPIAMSGRDVIGIAQTGRRTPLHTHLGLQLSE
jgi:hypothetical protein